MRNPAMPMFPLESALLPDEDLPLRIFEPRYAQLVTDCVAGDPVFGVVLIAAGREVGGGDDRYDIGTLARIVEHRAHGDGRHTVRCRIGERIRVRQWLPDDPYPRAIVEPWPDEPRDMLFAGVAMADGPGERLYALASRVPMGQADRYAVLAAPSAADRLEAL